MSRIYLDHAATTPLRPEARAAMEEGFRLWANPSSPHAEGRKARAALEGARAQVKSAFKWDGEVIFTSGASEAAERVFATANVQACWASAVEHDAVKTYADHDPCKIITVQDNGNVDLQACENACARSGSLIAIQHVNSETGNRQNIAKIGQLVHERDGVLLVDCAQSAGKFAIPSAADFAIVSAHKFGGPVGAAALLVKELSTLRPSGGQERGYRRGTENLPAVLGMAAALSACSEHYLPPEVLAPLASLADHVRGVGGVWYGDLLADPTPYIHAIAMPRLSGSAQLMRFDMAGIAVSQGSACSSGTMKRGHVLAAMGVPSEQADRTIRASFGWNTTRAEIERFCQVWLDMAKDA